MKTNSQVILVLALLTASPLITNCGMTTSNPNNGAAGVVEDSSASGAAAGAVGGALSDSSPNGTQASMSFKSQRTFFTALKAAINPLPSAFAESFCPTPRVTQNACSASGSAMFLTYDDCTFAGRATWNGVHAFSMSTGTAVCGTFPNPGANGTLYRQYVNPSNTSQPGEVTLATSETSGIVDDASANLANFDGDTLPTINSNGGYGAAVSFGSNGARDGITLGHHIAVQGEFDHSVEGNLSVNELPGANSRTVSGTVKVYHNLLRVIGTSTFNNVVHEDVCCLPVSGSITTAFTAGTNVAPTAAGQLIVNKSETLTFTGCGSAILQGADGSSKTVSLNRCF
jgi:hypothetical protein